jgi:asparagine synthase (glutamine-hydrolysing)
MCGICGIVGFGDERLLKKMTDVVAHRGPDDSGIYFSEADRIGFGHRRLSIIDLSDAGHQPMANSDQSIWITFNGEIFNFQHIRKDLEVKGYRFRSNSDTEVIIHAYEEWGIGCLDRLNGQFAFAIWDSRKKQLFLARDRLGIKPLYYSSLNGRFLFGSEIKSLLAAGITKCEIDVEALHCYLTFLWSPDPITMFKNIYKLPPGHYLILKDGALSIRQYWELRFEELNGYSEDYWEGKILEGLMKATQSQMISDVPLGAFLSGGIDSSAILALMHRTSGRRIVTYTAGFKREDLSYDIIPDDVRYARKVAPLMDAEYYEIMLEPKVVDLLPRLVWHLDEPVADGAVITTYLICKASREKLTVLLSGMGGDEIFGGYPRYPAMKLAQYYNKIPRFVREGVLRELVNRLPGAKPGRFTALFRNTKKLVKSASLPFQQRYLGFGTYFTDEEKQRLYCGELKASTNSIDAYRRHIEYFEKVKDEDPINQMMYIDVKTFLPCLNLTYTDKASMAASAEVRVPFLDHEFVELTAKIPAKLKLHGWTRKYIFKKAMSSDGELPKEIIWRKKAGFGAPVRAWVMKDLNEMIHDLLSEENIKRRGLFDHREVQRIIRENQSGREDNHLKIWQLLTLELWQRTFVDIQKT